MLAKNPYEMNALFLYYVNPLFSWPSADQWARALDAVPFVASFSPFMDETTAQADLILPDCTYLERWRDDEITHLAGITAFGIGAPVVPPLYETRATEDVILQIARKLGDPVSAVLPWEKYSDVLHEKAQGLYEAGRGHIAMSMQNEQFEAIQARQGYWRQQFSTYGEFWEELIRKGAWWDPNDTYVGPRQVIRTPTHKFEFYSLLLQDEWEAASRSSATRAGSSSDARNLASRLGIQAEGDLRFMPHHEPVPEREGDKQYPYLLNTYKLMSLAGGKGGNQPWLQQEPAVHVDSGWEGWVEVNPETAAALGIEDGSKVAIESSSGRIVVTARLFAGTAPDMLNMPYGWGHQAYGHWARNRGQNPNTVLAPAIDPVRGLPAWAGTRVRLTKA